MEGRCNGCGRCCEEEGFTLALTEEDITDWFYDDELDDDWRADELLFKITVEVDEYCCGVFSGFLIWDGMTYCSEKISLENENYGFGTGSMVNWVGSEDREAALDGTGKDCIFYDAQTKKCKIHGIHPKACREYFCKSGDGSDEDVWKESYYIETPYEKNPSRKDFLESKDFSER
jgi:Fe-S-cluster containining protein